MSRHPLAFEETPEERNARQQSAYEDKLTAYLLGQYKLTNHKAAMLKETDDHLLYLDQFVRRFGFPVYLAAGVIPWSHSDLTLDKLFNNFTTRKIKTRYEELEEEIIPEEYQGYPFGLVVKHPQISRGLILHNAAVDFTTAPKQEKPCVRLVWAPTKRTRNVPGLSYMTLEPFPQFIAALNWENEE